METAIQTYYEVEEQFFSNLRKKSTDNLLFYCATGSLARKEIIPNWSDIDIILIYGTWNEHVFSLLRETLFLNTTQIKIGATLYSLNEFNSYKYQDPKTFNAIRNIIRGVYTPRIWDQSVIVREMRPERIKEINRVEFAKTLHSFKRELLQYPELNERAVYKALTIMLRILLTEKGLATDGYSNIWKNIDKVFANLPLPHLTPQEILLHPEKIEERFIHYVNFLKWIEKINEKNNH